jgi:hypothetical protein
LFFASNFPVTALNSADSVLARNLLCLLLLETQEICSKEVGHIHLSAGNKPLAKEPFHLSDLGATQLSEATTASLSDATESLESAASESSKDG